MLSDNNSSIVLIDLIFQNDAGYIFSHELNLFYSLVPPIFVSFLFEIKIVVVDPCLIYKPKL